MVRKTSVLLMANAVGEDIAMENIEMLRSVDFLVQVLTLGRESWSWTTIASVQEMTPNITYKIMIVFIFP